MAASCVATVGPTKMFYDEDCKSPTMQCTSPGNLNLMSWQRLHPEQWSSDDVLNLIYHIAECCQEFNISRLNGERFQDVSGKDLYGMTKDNFLERDPLHGEMLHGLIQRLLKQSEFEAPMTTLADYDAENCVPKLEKTEEEFGDNFTDEITKAASFNIAGFQYDFDSDDLSVIQPSKLIFPECNATLGDNFRAGTSYTSEYHTMMHTGNRLQKCHLADDSSYLDEPIDLRVNCSSSSIIPTSDMASSTTSSQVFWSSSTTTTAAGLPVSVYTSSDWPTTNTDWTVPEISSYNWPIQTSASDWTTLSTADWPKPEPCSSWTNPAIASDWPVPATNWPVPVTTALGEWSAESIQTAIHPPENGTNVRGRDIFSQPPVSQANGKHLWEFICRLLKESDSVVSNRDRVIRWEDREQGVFRICDSKKVAMLWGNEKHNERMTYEKLSRALRWSRAYGYLADLPTTRRYPKKLCFRFGPRALNWKEFCTQ